jgi:hypothetical protein
MKVITKRVTIEDQEFALVKGEYNGKTYCGTIPYSETDENGKLKRELNGHDMCISFMGIGDAILQRKNRIAVEKYEAEGHTKAEVMMFIVSGYTAEGWDLEAFEQIKVIAE